ncbi:hypothetical protein BKE38_19655 [Pseudoroseomonas deserti]|uniref:Uncharacterized protein n=1 Tax=Teichococcus deserti TaxID=1817963 RepID=A0A1V2GYR9_9PROT|nr:hypothetical protein [Pseudoroseomonas deserti]ONG50056.1 hypothetical protein BKE38_19655 [Pseudoroseomonas deserti]
MTLRLVAAAASAASLTAASSSLTGSAGPRPHSATSQGQARAEACIVDAPSGKVVLLRVAASRAASSTAPVSATANAAASAAASTAGVAAKF